MTRRAEREPRQLRDYEKFQRGLRNYEWLGTVVPGATDLDVLVERQARFLVLEAKTWNHGVRVPIGQDIMLRQLDGIRAHAPECKQSKCPECGAGYRPFTVYLVGEQRVGEDEDADRFQVMRFGRPSPRQTLYPPGLFEPATRDDMRQLVHGWECGA